MFRKLLLVPRRPKTQCKRLGGGDLAFSSVSPILCEFGLVMGLLCFPFGRAEVMEALNVAPHLANAISSSQCYQTPYYNRY